MKKFRLYAVEWKFRLLTFNKKRRLLTLQFSYPEKAIQTQKPLLYYATSLYVEKGFDVPHLDYNELLQDLDKENCKEVINQVVQSFLQKHNYSKIHFVAKSIGTYALVHNPTTKRYPKQSSHLVNTVIIS